MYTAEERSIIVILRSLGIHITRCRLAVYRLFKQHKEALPVSYVNQYFSGAIDRISLYRVLKLFIEKKILVRLPSPKGDSRYIFSHHLPDRAGNCHVQIAYFTCSHCKQTNFLDDSILQQLTLPKNLNINQCYFLFEGLCSDCERKTGYSSKSEN